MIPEEVLGIREVEEVRRIEVNAKRIITWTLIFTNVFFVCYFFGKLFRWI